jgi:hypothetical protein
MISAEGELKTDRVIVAYLRTNILGAKNLLDALSKALLLPRRLKAKRIELRIRIDQTAEPAP